MPPRKKDKAVVFIYKMEHFINMPLPNVLLSGVDEDKTYRITDLTPAKEGLPSPFDGKTISGKILKYTGLNVSRILNREYTSLALQLEAID